MIKCIWYLKSLKQLFIIWLISCFILLGNSFVSAYTCSNDWNSCYDLEFWQVYSNFSWEKYIWNVVDRNFNFSSNVFLYNWYYQSTTFRRFWALWWETDWLHFTRQNYNATSKINWVLQWFFICSAMPENNSLLKNNNSCEFYTNFVDLKNYISNANRYLYYCNVNTTSNTCNICIYNNWWWDFVCVDYWSYYTSLTWWFLTEEEIWSRAIRNPFWSSSLPIPSTWNNQVWNWWELDWVNYTVIDTWDIVYYFENNPYYRFDKWVCYVWTNDFNTLYLSWSTLWLFRANSWWTIFDLFSSQFWNTFTINQVWTFINARNLNYFTWFKWWNRDENNVPMFNAYYSINSWFYQDFSDDLIVPFIWNPIAFYFMWYVSSLYWEYSTPWQAISTYCYYKLWLDKDSWSMNITDDSDSSYWNNANDFINQRNKFYWLSSWSMNIQSQSWSWTILDYFTWWEDNYDFNTFFSSSFNKFKNKISLNLSDLGAWFLPTWIIMFLIAIIFFRFLSH